MTADIFIPTNNNLKILKNCLDSLGKQSLSDFTIIIIGKEKNDSIRKLIETFTNLKIIYKIQNKQGLVGAANEALQLSKKEVFIRTDDDVIFDKDWFKNILQTFEMGPLVGAVTGPTLMNKKGTSSRDVIYFLEKFKNSSHPLLKMLKYIYLDYLYEGKAYNVSTLLTSGVFTFGSNFSEYIPNTPLRVNNLEACNFACRRNILEKIGGFDRTFENGMGDFHEADCAMKIQKAGYQIIFNPKAKLFHRVEFSSTKTRPDTFHRISNFIIFYFKHYQINSLDQLLRFFMNILFQNFYYFFKFASSGDWTQLGAVLGTIHGFISSLKIKDEN